MSANSPYGFLAWPDYYALPDQEETWIVEPLVPSGGWIQIHGESKSGKSLMMLNMAIAISTGQPDWLGFPIHRHGLVAYFQADNPRSLWKGNHLKALVDGGHISPNIWFSDPYLMPYPFDIMEEGNVGILADMVGRLPEAPILIIVDTIREIHGGDENDSGAMRQVYGLLREAVGQGPALGVVSHSRKGFGGAPRQADDGAEPDVMNSVRGSTYAPGKVDTMIHLTKQSKVTGARYMHYKGRATGLERKKVHLDEPNCWWSLDVDETAEHAKRLLTLRPNASVRELAKELAQKLECDDEKARSVLRRMKGRLK